MKSYERSQWQEAYPPKVKAMFEAVLELFASGRDLGTMKVAEITAKAGIGKGTAYQYFSTKEEIVIGALNYEAGRYMEILFRLLKEEKSFKEVVMRALELIEQANDRYHGFMVMESILVDREISGKNILKEMEKHKEGMEYAMKLRDEFVDLALQDESVKEQNRYKIESAILSQLVSYALYLTHQFFFSQVEQQEVREFAYESIIKMLN